MRFSWSSLKTAIISIAKINNVSTRTNSIRKTTMATATDLVQPIRSKASNSTITSRDRHDEASKISSTVQSPTQMASIDDPYILIDIGANLTNRKYSRDLGSVVSRAKEAGVQKIIVTGTSLHLSKEALRLTQMHPGSLYCTAGVHPHDAKSWEDDTVDALREIASHPECVAIGECGLDFNRNYSPQDVQLEVCEKQIQLACLIKKPLFVHEREAHHQLIAILEKYRDQLPATVIHCFTGTQDEAKVYLNMGLYIGLTGYVWKDKSENGVRSLLQEGLIPLDRLLVETDAPFMYPNTRGASKLPPDVREAFSPRSLGYLHRYCSFQRNEPCSLPLTVELIAALMRRKPDEVAMATTYNALKVFGMSGN